MENVWRGYGGPAQWSAFAWRAYGEYIWRIYMENMYGEYIWRICMENIYGEYVWRIYMENIHGEYVWRIYGENVENILRLCGECMKDRWKIDGDLAQKSAPCLGFRV